jgi:hypothetical protein
VEVNLKTGLRLLLPFTIFNTISILLALLFDDARGIYALLTGWGIGLVAVELHIPGLLQKWERTGIPGDPKTPEQQKQWEQEKGKAQMRRNLSILVGLIIAALGRAYLEKEMLGLIAIAIFAGIGTYFLRIGWLIYRKRGKLGP